MELENNQDDEWETEEEDYFRIKIENISLIKKKFNSFGKIKPIMKVKKIDKDKHKKIVKRKEYLNDEIFPNIKLLQPPILQNKASIDENVHDKNKSRKIAEKESEAVQNDVLGDISHLNHIILNKEIYNVNLNPEIGSSMIFKIKKKTNQNDVNSNSDTINIKQQIPANNLDFKDQYELEFKGVSTEYYECSTKVIHTKNVLAEYFSENLDKIIGNVRNKNNPNHMRNISESENKNLIKNNLDFFLKHDKISNINIIEYPSMPDNGNDEELFSKNKNNNLMNIFQNNHNAKNPLLANKKPREEKIAEINNNDARNINREKGSFQITQMFDTYNNEFNEEQEYSKHSDNSYNEDDFDVYEHESGDDNYNGLNYKLERNYHEKLVFEDNCNNKSILKENMILGLNENKSNIPFDHIKENKRMPFRNKNCQNIDKTDVIKHQVELSKKSKAWNDFNIDNPKKYNNIQQNYDAPVKRKKRKKFNYQKNSTIIEIKKIN